MSPIKKKYICRQSMSLNRRYYFLLTDCMRHINAWLLMLIEKCREYIKNRRCILEYSLFYYISTWNDEAIWKIWFWRNLRLSFLFCDKLYIMFWNTQNILFAGFELHLEQRKEVQSFHLKLFVKMLLRVNKSKKK